MPSQDIVPTRRSCVNGNWHMLLGAMHVTASDENTTVDLSTRRKGKLNEVGLTDNMIRWLDKLVEKKMPIPFNCTSKASGALLLSEHLIE